VRASSGEPELELVAEGIDPGRSSGDRASFEEGRALLRHRQRRASAVMGGVALLVVVVVAVGVWSAREPDDRMTTLAGGRVVVTDSVIGLGIGWVWPNEAIELPSAHELARAFADRVLGWPEAQVGWSATRPGSNWMTLRTGDGYSVEVLAAPIGGSWRLVQVGSPGGMGTAPGGGQTTLHLPAISPGAVALRWWVLADGLDMGGMHPDLAAPLTVPAEIASVQSHLAVFLDEEGRAIGAAGGHFAGE
jgi:hypothetical protein